MFNSEQYREAVAVADEEVFMDSVETDAVENSDQEEGKVLSEPVAINDREEETKAKRIVRRCEGIISKRLEKHRRKEIKRRRRFRVDITILWLTGTVLRNDDGKAQLDSDEAMYAEACRIWLIGLN